jgi:hypothetical protein
MNPTSSIYRPHVLTRHYITKTILDIDLTRVFLAINCNFYNALKSFSKVFQNNVINLAERKNIESAINPPSVHFFTDITAALIEIS